MSQIAAGSSQRPHAADGHAPAHSHGHGGRAVHIDTDNVTLSSAGGWSVTLLFIGIVGIIVTIIGGFTSPKHALAAYHTGALYALGLGSGGLMLTMIMHQFNAGWSVTLRRIWETLGSLLPLAVLLMVPSIATLFFGKGMLWGWSGGGHGHDPILEHKAVYLNVWSFLARFVIYAAVWGILGTMMYRWSRAQDQTGDRWLTARARFVSAPGIILLALTIAFAGFDWIMGLDHHWFSTMFGVYFFAGNILSTIALTFLIAIALRRAGKLKGLVTEEHFHDLGKLLLAFTVFWAYITFSQYFLIWYSNISEETGWYRIRMQNGWTGVGFTLAVFHFLVPFFLLLWKFSKRSMLVVGAIAAWQLVMHFVDLGYMVRPSVIPEHTPMQYWWIDIAGWLGPTCLFLGFVVQRLAGNPLIPIKDPRLQEAIEHKNYV